MRTFASKRNMMPGKRNLLTGIAAILLLASGLSAQAGVPFTARVSANYGYGYFPDFPYVDIVNQSRFRITRVEMTIGNLPFNFDYVFAYWNPPGGVTTVVKPGYSPSFISSNRSDTVKLEFSSFDPGETIRFHTEIDRDSTTGDGYHDLDYRWIFFNATNGAQNAKITVWDEAGNTEELTLSDPGAADLDTYTFESSSRSRILSVKSVGEADASDYVSTVQVKVNGNFARTNSSGAIDFNPSNGILRVGQIKSLTVYDDDQVEIVAPREVFKDINGGDITDSVFSDPQKIQDEAEERYTALGISVNEVPQTGDPTYFSFTVSRATDVIVKWRHDYALTIDSDFADTISPVSPGYAGPMTSKADGNPDPTVNKHWIKRNEPFDTEVDTQVLDFSKPGLDIRYIVKGYRASGPPRTGGATSTPTIQSIFAWPHQEVTSVASLLTNLPTTGQRQQVPRFTMSGPGKITYLWQIQFGVKVNVDSVSRASLPRVMGRSPGTSTLIEKGAGEGVTWFNPGDYLFIASPATDPGPNLALNGWINGDGNYFDSSAVINSANGSLSSGTNANIVWKPTFTTNSINYRGIEIAQLKQPARVLWTYGNQAVAVTVNIGEYVFQNDATLKTNFTIQPESMTLLSVSGRNQNVAGPEMAVWDPEARKLYPVVPGQFRATWKRGVAPNFTATNDVIVTAQFPTNAHYPHVAGTPPVALDPDPNDSMIYRGLKYTENSASVDGGKLFTANQPGRTVLLFGNLQSVGRGEPREFVAVRVVHTRDYQDVLSTDNATIGKKIEAADLDLAKLGTGFVMSFEDLTGQPERARYNPFIYDRTKLEGLAARDVYDMTQLLSSSQTLQVVHKDVLPGPIIPVNLHPGAHKEDRIIVVWYDNPADNDTLLWPHRARLYLPQWPSDPGKIVIASQFGSEGVVTNGTPNTPPVDQIVVPALTVPGVGSFPAQTTYNPSRLQSVQIYNQPNANLPGYNPNEEHALMAPSLRFAAVSPRPPAAYALRDNDLNIYNKQDSRETNQPANYSSHPYVLVQFFDTADQEFKMRVYQVSQKDISVAGYSFADQTRVSTNGFGTNSVPPLVLESLPHVVMEAGEPVIPFYPLGVVIGASPCPETFGANLRGQTTYWEDHKGSSWAISGGTNAFFSMSFYYPLQPDFWWPPGKSGFIVETESPGVTTNAAGVLRRAAVPEVGDCISFLPPNASQLMGLAANAEVSPAIALSNSPIKILYKSEWPDVAPVLKAGETLTFQGGEFRADHPTMPVIDDEGDLSTIQTPGLPGILAFASAEVVFDTLNPNADSELWKRSWTARVTQVLDKRSVVLSIGKFPPELQPANGRTRVKNGKFIFNDLPASLQKRIRFDPLAISQDPTNFVAVNGKLEMTGLVNDKEIGNDTLTAAPPAVYILEPNIMTLEEREQLESLDNVVGSDWDNAVKALYDATRNPNGLTNNGDYLAGLQPAIIRNGITGLPEVQTNASGLSFPKTNSAKAEPYRAFGPGLALVPNAGFLDPQGIIPGAGGGPFPDISWVTVAENNDPSFGGAPITLHVIKVDRRERYRGAIKTVLSDNVFDENLVLRHTGDFGANADELFFEWWYRPDDGSLNVPPPDLLQAGQPNPWKLFPDPSGKKGQGRYQVTLKGNPNAPEALLADTFWFCRYRHNNDRVVGTDWNVSQNNGAPRVNFTWAGAGNSDPFNDFDGNGIPDYRAQLASGWIKRVLSAVNPYEARIRDFEGDNPSTVSSMIQQFGPRFEGPVALNPDPNVIQNVGLIELYETILKRGRDFSIDLSTPVSTPAIANALQLASTRISDFYTILGNEAYTDALDPTIGFGSDSVEYGNLAPAVFAFQNQMPTLLDEELGLLRGADDFFARPVYNRLFWNFTVAEGEAAYAMNYNISDINQDGFIDEDDAMILYPQGHGDAWGHYLTAVRHQYDLLRHDFFNWVSRSEFYNLQDIVIKVDFLDERKFAQIAAAKAKVGAEIVNLTYRQKYVEDPNAQWQGYTDSNKDRAWGVQEWARRAGQGAFFDWVTANALLPSKHPNETLEGIQKVDRSVNSDISVVSANLNAVQRTFDQANKGENPLGLSGNSLVFDIDPTFLEVGSTAQIGTRAVQGLHHFDQIYERAIKMLENTVAIWNNANETQNMLRQIGNSELEFRNSTFQEDLSYRNQLISIFGKPYEGTIGPGKVYPAGYDGPDLLLYMYVDVRKIDKTTVPRPTTDFAVISTNGNVTSGAIYSAINSAQGAATNPVDKLLNVDANVRTLFAPTFVTGTDGLVPALAESGLYSVKYTDLLAPKVPLVGLTNIMPITAAGYTFQAPPEWGSRRAVGELQLLINQMIQQEASVASAIGAWDALQGAILREVRLVNAKLDTAATIRQRNEIFSRVKVITLELLKGIAGVIEAVEATKEIVQVTFKGLEAVIPTDTPTAGLAFSAGDVLAPVKGGITAAEAAVQGGMSGVEAGFKIAAIVAEGILTVAENELNLAAQRDQDALAAKEMLVALENLTGDEPIKRIEIFKEVQALRDLSDQYRAKLDEGSRLVDERAAFNKRVAAQTQRNRYQDMTFRVSRNHALQTYRAAFDLTARYAYLAVKAYDYETNFDPTDPGSPAHAYGEIMRARSLGQFSDGQPRIGSGGVCEALAKVKQNYEVLKGQLGINNPAIEIGKSSLRTENYRILPKTPPTEIVSVDYITNTVDNVTTITTVLSVGEASAQQPTNAIYGFPAAGADSDELWRKTLQDGVVDDLWQLPEYRYYCRPFNGEADGSGTNHVREPGIVLRFGTQIMAGRNVFGKPLAGGDNTYDPSHYATKIQSVGVWFSDYLSGDVVNELPATPRVYLIPVGADVMSVPSSPDPGKVRMWKVIDQKIPVPLASTNAAFAGLNKSGWIPLIDSLNGRLGDPRQYSMFRAYHNGGSDVDDDELVLDTRLVARSVWNTEWLLIIPGRMLNFDPDEGLRRFIDQVSDVKLVFRTYSLAGD